MRHRIIMKEQMTESDAVNDEDVLMTEDHHQEDQDGVNFGDDDSSLLNENNLNGPVDDLTDTSDLPTSLIVTNLDTRIFSSGDLKLEFEGLFRRFEENTTTFQYFKSFKRARVNYSDPKSAARARIQCHQIRVGDAIINCYFCQSLEKDEVDSSSDGSLLKPPSPQRQFLISPPASPPVGWAPVPEAEPLINFELLAAISRLTPGEAHELHPPSESQPGIIVHVCEDLMGDDGKPLKNKIQQTRRPPADCCQEST